MIYKSKIIDDCALKSDTDLYEPLDVLIKSLNEEANLSRLGSFDGKGMARNCVFSLHCHWQAPL